MMINVQKITSAKRDVNKSFCESFVMVKSKPKKAETFMKRFPLFCSTVRSFQPSGLLFNRQVLIFMFYQPGFWVSLKPWVSYMVIWSTGIG